MTWREHIVVKQIERERVTHPLRGVVNDVLSVELPMSTMRVMWPDASPAAAACQPPLRWRRNQRSWALRAMIAADRERVAQECLLGRRIAVWYRVGSCYLKKSANVS